MKAEYPACTVNRASCYMPAHMALLSKLISIARGLNGRANFEMFQLLSILYFWYRGEILPEWHTLTPSILFYCVLLATLEIKWKCRYSVIWMNEWMNEFILMTFLAGKAICQQNDTTYYYNNNCLLHTFTNWANWCTTGISLHHINNSNCLFKSHSLEKRKCGLLLHRTI